MNIRRRCSSFVKIQRRWSFFVKHSEEVFIRCGSSILRFLYARVGLQELTLQAIPFCCRIPMQKLECQAVKLVVRFGKTLLHVFLVSPYLKHPIRHKPQNLLAFMYLWLWWSTRIHVEAANDNLNPGDTLNFTAGILCSKKVTYCLGFTPFTGGENVYLVVVSNKSVEVWMKNQPVDKDSTVFSLNRSGVLKIESKRGMPIILYSPPKDINNTKATLLDTCNFLLVADLEWEHVGQDLIIRRWGKVCWRSGKLKNNIFDTPLCLTGTKTPSLSQLQKMKTLFDGGHYQILGRYFDGEVYVARAYLCYEYNNTDKGCQRWQDIPKCRNPGDVFQKHNVYVRVHNVSTEENISYGHSDCEASCWSNCACSGFMDLNSNGTGSENYTSDITGYDFYLLVNTLALHKEKKSRRKVTKMAYLATCSRSSAMEDFEDDLKKGHGLTMFNYTSVMEATNGFSSENKLGQGGFEPIYKGILPTGQQIAVKRLSKTSGQGIVEFKNELVDPSIKESIDPDEVQKCIHIGLLCVEHYADDQPTMSEIVSMLTNKSAILSLPQTPAFYVGKKILHENLSSKGSCTDSAVEITASTIDMTDS
ncbi:hypothetical protein V8G54_024827 [Vigna mungo]|uniref:Uncharacterized protein n=1 Tax=Vigna mungo TaxID=3915 RepID=A0AAQ3RTS9_VIGMU